MGWGDFTQPIVVKLLYTIYDVLNLDLETSYYLWTRDRGWFTVYADIQIGINLILPKHSISVNKQPSECCLQHCISYYIAYQILLIV